MTIFAFMWETFPKLSHSRKNKTYGSLRPVLIPYISQLGNIFSLLKPVLAGFLSQVTKRVPINTEVRYSQRKWRDLACINLAEGI